MKDSAAKDWALGLHEPMTTQVASSSQHALITPFLIDTQFTHSRGDRSADLREPMHTQTAQQSRALVVPPFITSYYAGGGQDSSIEEPMPTLPTRDRHAVVVPPFIVSQYNRPAGIGAAVRDLREPMPTVPAMAVHHVVTPPFIINQQANTAPTAMHEAMATLLASGNHKWLVEPGEAVQVEDCGFRMLEPEECGAAMAFPSDYKVLGGKRDRVKQYGNAVTPPVMDILMQRCMEALR
jgi:DNA (cytosine-5)-methyltransferase 1